MAIAAINKNIKPDEKSFDGRTGQGTDLSGRGLLLNFKQSGKNETGMHCHEYVFEILMDTF